MNDKMERGAEAWLRCVNKMWHVEVISYRFIEVEGR
jgi:hypothetical protein